MPQVADHLAELTGFRDRDVPDTTLVGVLRELLRHRPLRAGQRPPPWPPDRRRGAVAVAASDARELSFPRSSHGGNQVAEHAALAARGELLEGQKTGDVELF